LVWATKFFHCSLHGDQGRTFMSFVRVNWLTRAHKNKALETQNRTKPSEENS
jgi:hypothetical protein